MKAPGTGRLTLKHDELLSSFAFKFNLRRYTVGKHHKLGTKACNESLNPLWEVSLGRIVGYVSSLFYLGSRQGPSTLNNAHRVIHQLLNPF